MINTIVIIALSVVSGIAYRAGGSGNYPRWTREVGVGACYFISLLALFGWHWYILSCLGTVWIETTYFKSKGKDAKWFNWFFVGLSYSVVPLLFVLAIFVFNHKSYWIGFWIRSFVVTAFTTIWRTFIGKDVLQEFGCGFIQTVTMPLLLGA